MKIKSRIFLTVASVLIIAGGLVNSVSAAPNSDKASTNDDKGWGMDNKYLTSLGGLDELGRSSLLANFFGTKFNAVKGQVNSGLASRIAQVSYHVSNRFKLSVKPRILIDKVREVWLLQDGTVVTIFLDKDKPFSCTVTGQGSSLVCDEEPVSKG